MIAKSNGKWFFISIQFNAIFSNIFWSRHVGKKKEMPRAGSRNVRLQNSHRGRIENSGNCQNQWIETQQSSFKWDRHHLDRAAASWSIGKQSRISNCSFDPEISLVSFQVLKAIFRDQRAQTKAFPLVSIHPCQSLASEAGSLLYVFWLRHLILWMIVCYWTILNASSYSPWFVTASKTMDTSRQTQSLEASM